MTVLVGAVTPLLSQTIPTTTVTALDGHTLHLPQDLSAGATVFIVGFGRHSSDATTAWEKPVRTRLAHAPGIQFYDAAMIAEVPGFMRSTVTRLIRGKVPEVLRPNFLPLAADEPAWKTAAGYTDASPEVAYVFVVDHTGAVRWSTHAGFTEAGFAQLTEATQRVAAAANRP